MYGALSHERLCGYSSTTTESATGHNPYTSLKLYTWCRRYTRRGKHRGQVLGSVGRVYGHWALGRHRGYLTVLNDRSAKAVNEDGRAISPESSDLSTTIKIDWPT
ncbi:hypothetical protein SNOG_07274 [Parastagonospora nodorum SN15]|uniref:Uncharacterized protein n=1 Tax=Phaeosphaeria nodorum (strain SN15 / ATCC MYA-4574 / FGSC 10173) TaxID=321614 RepID=Q0ULU0_PHANO|nr:hypothetical protein SNOG_07274 [Parastagonospora nodorum SN15]EAT85925.1 hypothetical protein SNOG_07274 [Parastagonospora nodorum SN15]